MFEQATLESGPAGKRVWTTFLGVTGQAALVSLAVLVPLVSPQVLPLARLEISLAPPVPPRPQQLDGDKAPIRQHVVHTPFRVGPLFAPATVPTTVDYHVVDEPPGAVVGGVPAGYSAGTGNTIVDGILNGLGDARPLLMPHINTVPVAEVKPPSAVAPIIRYTQGGNVKLGNPLRRVEPVYPAIAKAARASGIVQLECVVGVDGRIIEVKVKSGSPLLVKAAVDAAWQWLYLPSRLNDVPIEIITNLNFNFKLN